MHDMPHDNGNDEQTERLKSNTKISQDPHNTRTSIHDNRFKNRPNFDYKVIKKFIT